MLPLTQNSIDAIPSLVIASIFCIALSGRYPPLIYLSSCTIYYYLLPLPWPLRGYERLTLRHVALAWRNVIGFANVITRHDNQRQVYCRYLFLGTIKIIIASQNCKCVTTELWNVELNKILFCFKTFFFYRTHMAPFSKYFDFNFKRVIKKIPMSVGTTSR